MLPGHLIINTVHVQHLQLTVNAISGMHMHPQSNSELCKTATRTGQTLAKLCMYEHCNLREISTGMVHLHKRKTPCLCEDSFYLSIKWHDTYPEEKDTMSM